MADKGRRTVEYRKTILSSIAVVLRPGGFRQKGVMFSRDLGDVVHLVSLQSSVAMKQQGSRSRRVSKNWDSPC